MGGKTASLLVIMGLAVLLGGCSADKPPKVESNLYPKDYQPEIIATLKKEVFDKNDTVRVTNALVSDPALQQVGKEQHYIACVHYTAHGAVAGEIGSATRIAYFYGGHLNQLIPAQKNECANAAYKLFPALNQVCLGKGCK
jgi:hypothetical protein